MINATILPNRGYIILSGEDQAPFLQGLLTNDVTKINDHRSIYALLLTPQGRYCYDLIITQVGNDWIIEGDADRLSDLTNKLNTYKLRSQITITADPDYCVVAMWDPHTSNGDPVAQALELAAQTGATKTTSLWTAVMDPRLTTLGARLRIKRTDVEHLSDCLGVTLVDEDEYRHHRITHGVPESAAELIVDKSIPLECGMDELNAIDWDKGCYVGQELTARTRYRGLVRKRLLPFTLLGPVNHVDPIMNGDAEVGTWYAISRDQGLALLRLEALKGTLMTSGGVEVLPNKPDWIRLPEEG